MIRIEPGARARAISVLAPRARTICVLGPRARTISVLAPQARTISALAILVRDEEAAIGFPGNWEIFSSSNAAPSAPPGPQDSDPLGALDHGRSSGHLRPCSCSSCLVLI